MRIVIALIVPLLLLAACGNDEEVAAKKAEYNQIKAQLKALNAELASKMKEWQKVKQTYIPASQTLKRALGSGDKDAIAAAQAAFDEAQAANDEVSKMEQDIRSRISTLNRKKRKLVDSIQALGGGNLEP